VIIAVQIQAEAKAIIRHITPAIAVASVPIERVFKWSTCNTSNPLNALIAGNNNSFRGEHQLQIFNHFISSFSSRIMNQCMRTFNIKKY